MSKKVSKIQLIRVVYAEDEKFLYFSAPFTASTLIGWNLLGLSKKRGKSGQIEIRSVYNGYSDLEIGISGIQFKSFQLRS